MTLLGAVAISFGSALVAAFAWVMLVRATEKYHEWHAGLWDVLLVGMGYVPIQLWGDLGQHSAVFYARVVGSALATVLTIKALRHYKRKRTEALLRGDSSKT